LVLLGGLVAGGGFLAYWYFRPRLAAMADKTESADAEEAPLPEGLALKPPALAADKVTVRLPASVADLCAGGGGRFLILHLPQPGQLAIFDVTEAKIVKYLPLAGDHPLLAASLDKLLVIYPDKNLMQRWSLLGFEREVTAPLPIEGKVSRAALGSASQGPLILYGPEVNELGGLPLHFVDIQTLKAIPVTMGEAQGGPLGFLVGNPQMPPFLSASADGKILGLWNPAGPGGVGCVILDGRRLNTYYDHQVAGPAIPAANGQALYTGTGVYNPELKRMGGAAQSLTLPSVQGNYYLSIANPFGGGFPGQPANNRMPLTVHLAGDARPLATLDDLEGLDRSQPWGPNATSLPLDKRIAFIPEAKLIITLPPTADQLYLRRFDLDEALEKSGIDYLVVTSQPPARFTPGKTLSYRLAVKSKKGGIKYKLEAAPEGMTLSPSGQVHWSVPLDFNAPEVDVIITIGDATGQEVFHTFKLRQPDRAIAVNDKPAPPKAPPAAAPPPADAPPPVVAPGQANPAMPEIFLPFVDGRPAQPLQPRRNPGALAKGAPLVRPATAVLPIKAAPLEDTTKVQLPSAVQNVCIGGGGRFIILHLAREHKLAIFDANEARVVKYLPLTEDRILFAAGMDKLLVVLPDKNVVQRWSLITFEREVAAPLPVQGNVTAIGMGSATNGPLLLSGPDPQGGAPQGGLIFLDVPSLKEVAVDRIEPGDPQAQAGFGGWGAVPDPIVSADGRVVVLGRQTWVLSGNRIKTYSLNAQVAHVLPGPDGRMLFTSEGLYTVEGKKIGGGEPGPFALPALQGNAYLSITNPNGQLPGQSAARPRAVVHLVGDGRPLVTLNSLKGLEPPDPFGRSGPALPLDRRVFFIPQAKLIVTIPRISDLLYLHHFDLDEALEKSGIDYLVVTSQPPAAAIRGKPYSYALAVKSRKGGVKYKLEAGPDGMAVSPDGKLTWDVPAAIKGTEVDVILTVSDASGQEVLHTFKIAINDKPDRADPAPRPEPGRPQRTEKPAPPPKPPGEKPIRPAAQVPLPKQFEIKPAPLVGDTETCTLPCAIDDVVIGGGGRFLILSLPKERKLAVFDVNVAKVVKYLPVPETPVRFAAGMDKLLVAIPSKGLLQRWDLATLQREVTSAVPVPGTVQGLSMGCASAGPLYLLSVTEGPFGRFDGHFLDPRTLKSIDYRQEDGPDKGRFGGSNNIRASADGTVFAWGASNGAGCIMLNGKTAKTYTGSSSTFLAWPAADGRYVYTAIAVMTPEMREVFKPTNPGNVITMPLVPSPQGPFYLWIEDHDSQNMFRPGARGRAGAGDLHFFVEGQTRPFYTWKDFPGVFGQKVAFVDVNGLTAEKRYILLPRSRVLITIPQAEDRLVLHRFDVDALLEKSGVDYLIVLSSPPRTAARGAAYRYPLEVKSRRGKVKYKVEAGPRDLTVSADGKVSWPVPADFEEKEVDVILTVSDASGQEVFHTFKITVAD
jgi:hypothetical protein